MTARPRPITLLSWLFIAIGAVGLVYEIAPFASRAGVQQLTALPKQEVLDLVYIGISRLCAVISGMFMLRGFNWARWLLVIWMAFHIWLSALHSTVQLITHAVLFLAVTYVLFRRESTAFFRP